MTQPVALITGASSGIGRAIALKLASANTNLALVGRDLLKLQAVQQEVNKLGVTARVYSIDMARPKEVKPQIESIIQAWGRLDTLVNNAGIGYTNSLLDTPLAEWQQVLDINLTSAFQCIQAVLPVMRQQQQGTIINIASIAAKNAFPGWGVYSASKAALASLSQTLRAEERINGIRVTTICPGAVDTPIWDSPTVQVELNRAAMLTPDSIAQLVWQILLLPNTAVVEELILMPNAGAL